MKGQQAVIEGIFDDVITLKLKPGERLPAVRKLCEKYSVAHITAWKACNALKEMGIIFAEGKRGNFVTSDAVEKVNKHLFQRKRRVVILSHFEDDPLDDFYPRIFQLLVSKLAINTWRDRLSLLSVFSIDELENILNNSDTDVLIVNGMELPERILKRIKQQKIKFLCLESPQGKQLPLVKWNEYAAGYKLGKYLLDLGHQKMAWFGKKNIDRVHGVLHAFNDAGIKKEALEVFECRNSPSEVCKKIERLTKEKRLPNAMIFFYDGMAVQAVKTLRGLGVDIPTQVSIASFGNTHYAAYMHPELTSVDFDARAFVKETLNALEDLLFGRNTAEQVKIIEPELIIRNSCLPPGYLNYNKRSKAI
jgi:DNA-binding LacI/PurR family transcriptional regulator